MRPNPTRFLLSAVAALGATAAVCAAALASSSYTAIIKLPADTIGPGHSFKVKTSGVSRSRTQLTVYLSKQSKSCASTSKAEASRAAQKLISKRVDHAYTSLKVTRASQTTGVYYACAYLTAGSRTRAHYAKKWYDVIGGY